MCFSVLMMFFFVCCAAIETYKPRFGHETGYTIILGIIMSLLIYAIVGDEVAHTFHFSQGLFFNIFLPPIIFNSGFNMQKKMFFRNLGNVSMFGLVVTLCCFIMYSAATIFVIKTLQPSMTDYSALNQGIELDVPNPMQLDITVMQTLLFTALVCSSDVVAAVSIVDYTQQPKLYSCIFGEGVMNDIVSIILFNTVLNLQSVEF
jgi:NhaP-type Na+/H+ or K+/H+ antiporter